MGGNCNYWLYSHAADDALSLSMPVQIDSQSQSSVKNRINKACLHVVLLGPLGPIRLGFGRFRGLFEDNLFTLIVAPRTPLGGQLILHGHTNMNKS